MTRARAGLVALLLALSACQPLPHPFADDRPPASLLAVRDSRGVSIAPIAGAPRAAAVRLRAAVAEALRKDDIPASDSTASVTSYQLAGRIDERPSDHGRAVLTVHWRLTDAAGRVVGQRRGQLEAASAEWRQGDAAVVDRLAVASAAALVPLLSDSPPPAAAVASIGSGAAVAHKGPVVLVAQVGGAPGDGDAALTSAMVAVLKSQQLDVVTGRPNQKPDLTVEGRVAVTPIDGDKQHVAIVWALRRADGSQVGTVGQQNDVPKGSLDHRWGDIAYNVAVAARSGILELVVRAEAGGNGKKS
jgi:hypothetical protein